jgi:hypothetical protein
VVFLEKLTREKIREEKEESWEKEAGDDDEAKE